MPKIKQGRDRFLLNMSYLALSLVFIGFFCLYAFSDSSNPGECIGECEWQVLPILVFSCVFIVICEAWFVIFRIKGRDKDSYFYQCKDEGWFLDKITALLASVLFIAVLAVFSVVTKSIIIHINKAFVFGFLKFMAYFLLIGSAVVLYFWLNKRLDMWLSGGQK